MNITPNSLATVVFMHKIRSRFLCQSRRIIELIAPRDTNRDTQKTREKKKERETCVRRRDGYGVIQLILYTFLSIFFLQFITQEIDLLLFFTCCPITNENTRKYVHIFLHHPVSVYLRIPRSFALSLSLLCCHEFSAPKEEEEEAKMGNLLPQSTKTS